jgi:hypothetical protein
VSSKNWNRLVFFVAGTFLGGYVLSVFGGIFGRASG